MIPYGRQTVSQDDIDAVISVLQSDWLTQGPAIEGFEAALASYTGAAFSLAVSNGTAALHLACLALGMGKADRVWTSPITFVASANCARYCGAQVDFVDVEPGTWNISIESLTAKLRQAKQDNKLPSLLIVVHFAGQSCDMAAISQLADEYGFAVIEDASHALGADYEQGKVGNCRYSSMSIFSFHPVKMITTGEGGAITTNDPQLHKALLALRTHGIVREPEDLLAPADGPWSYEQHSLGYNYRITDMQAALGQSQLKKLDQYVAQRRTIVQRYNDMLSDTPVQCPIQKPQGAPSWHIYPICLWYSAENPKNLGTITQARRQIFTGLREQGIGVQVHYIPVYRQPYYADMGFSGDSFPVAESYYAGAITLPVYPALSEDDQQRVVDVLHDQIDLAANLIADTDSP